MHERFGPYLLLKQLGSGAMGDAFMALPLGAYARFPSPLVIKRLHLRLSTDPNYQRRFQHEARIATRIDSPHLPRVYDVGRVEETFYIAMEFIRGWSLARVVEDLTVKRQRPSLESIVDIVAHTLKGLAALHSARDEQGTPLSVVHRDISPKNLIVGEDGLTRVIDLGLGKSARQDWKTRTGAVMGTPGYMAPEQVLAREVDHRSDLYAVGVIFWELLTGQPYVLRSSVQKMLVDSVKATYRPPSSLSEVPPSLDDVLRRALAHDPKERFATAEEFLAAIFEVTPPAQRPPVSSLIGQILWHELADATTEMQKLVEQARAHAVPQTVDPKTIVISIRDEVSTEIPETSAPPTISTIRMDPPPARASLRLARPIALLALVVATLSAGMWLGSSRSVPPPPPTMETPPPPAPIEAPKAIAAPIDPPPSEPPRKAKVRAPEKIATLPQRAPDPPPPPQLAHRLAQREGEPARAWVDRLTRTAAAWRKTSPDSDRRLRLEEVLGRLARHASSTRIDQELEKIDALARELETLAPE